MAKNTGAGSPIAVAKALKGMNFPAGKQQLEEHARAQGADRETLKLMSRLPEREYRTVAEVEQGVGEIEQ